ncbi:MAG: hypothetical protein D6679_11305 [Candidatus Hydrogenedentota bacterium]|nr:MAG: hypothetical protein D6679_11305 [Candidatus Hydrogenedentota bacterium]
MGKENRSSGRKGEERDTVVSRSKGILLPFLIFLIGILTALYLHSPALLSRTVYRSDLRQAIHWAAYHTTTFRQDDLLLAYARFNESPVQNVLYWYGTLFLDVILLSKVLAILGYALAGLCAYFAALSFTNRTGAFFSACFFLLCPDQFVYYSGGFSKAWMMPLLMITIRFLERERWQAFLLLMPFAALAYPVAAVLIGMTVLVHLLLYRRNLLFPPGRPVFFFLAGSFVALVILLLRFGSPKGFIGPLGAHELLMRTEELYEGGAQHYLPTPSLLDALLPFLTPPFVLVSAFLIFLLLKPKEITWPSSFSSLLVASIIGYLLADLLFIRLYIPNRYLRYTIPVLLSFWHGVHLPRVVKKIPRPGLRAATVLILASIAVVSYRGDFKPGKETLDRSRLSSLCRFFETTPPGTLISGHPYVNDDIPIQARRSVLCNYKLAHPWFPRFYALQKERTLATFRAIYAADTKPLIELRKRYGVDLLVIRKKKDYSRKRIRKGRIYLRSYRREIDAIIGDRRHFLLEDPPPEWIVYEDERYRVIDLRKVSRRSSRASRNGAPNEISVPLR